VISIEEDHERAGEVAAAIQAAVKATIEGESVEVEHLAVIITGHDTVLALNRQFLEHDYHTDVLAFDLRDDDTTPLDGEVYVDLDTAIEYCEAEEVNLLQESARYAIHGTLHLMGYSDKDETGKAAMRNKEDAYLAVI
jgi:probable rRNA maturation factor